MAGNPISIAITGALEKLIGSRTAQNMRMTVSDQLRSQLSPNLLISGTVTANLGQNKYAVKFMKESAVVESKTPLTVNELLHGRVVGIGDKIELQRVFKEKASADHQAAKQANWEHLASGGNHGTRAVDVLQSYRVNLSVDEQLSLAAMLKGNIDAEAMILSAVVLNKMGITVTNTALATLYPVLNRTLSEKFNLQNITAHIDFEATLHLSNDVKTIGDLSRFIAGVVNELPEAKLQSHKSEISDTLAEGPNGETGSGDTTGDGQRDADDNLFDARRLLLNAQSDGSVSHRITVVPFLVNERLIEVDMALFSQRQRQMQGKSIEYRKIALSLDLDTLGKIDVQINMANRNARVSINTENNLITDALVKYMPNLRQDFDNFNIKLDELSYGVIERNRLGNVIGSVVEHYITQDSLSRVY